MTGGTNTGVTQLVGECVRDFNESARGKNDTCLAIGIINLGHYKNTGLHVRIYITCLHIQVE